MYDQATAELLVDLYGIYDEQGAINRRATSNTDKYRFEYFWKGVYIANSVVNAGKTKQVVFIGSTICNNKFIRGKKNLIRDLHVWSFSFFQRVNNPDFLNYPQYERLKAVINGGHYRPNVSKPMCVQHSYLQICDHEIPMEGEKKKDVDAFWNAIELTRAFQMMLTFLVDREMEKSRFQCFSSWG